jgi:hypothetical protein
VDDPRWRAEIEVATHDHTVRSGFGSPAVDPEGADQRPERTLGTERHGVAAVPEAEVARLERRYRWKRGLGHRQGRKLRRRRIRAGNLGRIAFWLLGVEGDRRSHRNTGLDGRQT